MSMLGARKLCFVIGTWLVETASLNRAVLKQYYSRSGAKFRNSWLVIIYVFGLFFSSVLAFLKIVFNSLRPAPLFDVACRYDGNFERVRNTLL